ncbi:MAG: hypothetical protein MRJ68_12600 [Nitrospira sp.]|nr:hypothetical protein [Nitrospira sp.]
MKRGPQDRLQSAALLPRLGRELTPAERELICLLAQRAAAEHLQTKGASCKEQVSPRGDGLPVQTQSVP